MYGGEKREGPKVGGKRWDGGVRGDCAQGNGMEDLIVEVVCLWSNRTLVKYTSIGK